MPYSPEQIQTCADVCQPCADACQACADACIDPAADPAVIDPAIQICMDACQVCMDAMKAMHDGIAEEASGEPLKVGTPEFAAAKEAAKKAAFGG